MNGLLTKSYSSDKQHIAIVIGLGGLTPCPELVDAVLTPVEGEVKRVLDLGMNFSF
jgi:hypothetical protein